MPLGTMNEFNNKKEVLTKDLEAAQEESQFTFENSEVNRLSEALKELDASKHEYEDVVEKAEGIPDSQLNEVAKLGGTEGELQEKLGDVNKEIDKVEGAIPETHTEPELEPRNAADAKEASPLEITKEEFSKKFDNQLQSLVDTEDRFRRKLSLQEDFYKERTEEYKKFKEAGGDTDLKGVPFEHNQKYFDSELNSISNMVDLLHRGLTEVANVRQEINKRIENF
jgi:chromosome segregation ATPase